MKRSASVKLVESIKSHRVLRVCSRAYFRAVDSKRSSVSGSSHLLSVDAIWLFIFRSYIARANGCRESVSMGTVPRPTTCGRPGSRAVGRRLRAWSGTRRRARRPWGSPLPGSPCGAGSEGRGPCREAVAASCSGRSSRAWLRCSLTHSSVSRYSCFSSRLTCEPSGDSSSQRAMRSSVQPLSIFDQIGECAICEFTRSPQRWKYSRAFAFSGVPFVRATSLMTGGW